MELSPRREAQLRCYTFYENSCKFLKFSEKCSKVFIFTAQAQPSFHPWNSGGFGSRGNRAHFLRKSLKNLFNFELSPTRDAKMRFSCDFTLLKKNFHFEQWKWEIALSPRREPHFGCSANAKICQKNLSNLLNLRNSKTFYKKLFFFHRFWHWRCIQNEALA